MKIIKRYFNVCTSLVIATLQANSAYRGAALLWIVNGFIIPLILMSIWLTIRRANQLAMDDSQIITYYLTSIVVIRLTQSWVAEGLGRRIKEGEMSAYLVRPVGYWVSGLSIDTGMKLIRLVSLVPFVVIFYLLFNSTIALKITPLSVTLFLISIGIGYLLDYFMQNIVGLASFWLQHTYGVLNLYETTNWLFNGSLIPAALMPATLLTVTTYTPFWYIIGFPIAIVMGSLSSKEILTGFCIACIWLCIIFLLWKWVYHHGIKNYTAVGI